MTMTAQERVAATDTLVQSAKPPYYLSVQSNALYDLAAIPALAVECYVGHDLSVVVHGHYAWWKCDHKHNYWRTYGGDLALRYWFGAASHKPLTGHHLGVYGQMLTYDFELGERGYLGPKWSYGGGVEYGYSFPVGRRFNIDTALGIGYLTGTYKEYLPKGKKYVWQATKELQWIGPTQASVSLVWLLGRGNVNKR